ncbi:hypothetical protein GCM10023225_02050 [Kineococcus glutinatus]|uniref:Uncharacterized protein n=1 Tax=Kineococcus glutinatus TaxID=1070872 RepID=A0ABP9H4Z4_9ACTN
MEVGAAQLRQRLQVRDDGQAGAGVEEGHHDVIGGPGAHLDRTPPARPSTPAQHPGPAPRPGRGRARAPVVGPWHQHQRARGAPMSKRGRKRRSRKGNAANHGNRPNA